MTATGSSRRGVAYGPLPVVVLGATLAIEAAERMALAQAVEGIQAEFGISDTAVGLLPAAMIVVGVLGALGRGGAAARGPRPPPGARPRGPPRRRAADRGDSTPVARSGWR
jgi:hypothetical protein